jgi:hypothetical protein
VATGVVGEVVVVVVVVVQPAAGLAYRCTGSRSCCDDASGRNHYAAGPVLRWSRRYPIGRYRGSSTLSCHRANPNENAEVLQGHYCYRPRVSGRSV